MGEAGPLVFCLPRWPASRSPVTIPHRLLYFYPLLALVQIGQVDRVHR